MTSNIGHGTHCTWNSTEVILITFLAGLGDDRVASLEVVCGICSFVAVSSDLPLSYIISSSESMLFRRPKRVTSDYMYMKLINYYSFIVCDY